ncbi:MAG: PD-(D/E)XK nuclease family protein [Candidatus Methylomirabilia bacterium]
MKWVIVPTHALGHTLGERLALEGTGWANLRFTPPLDLALEMAAPFLVERGVDPSPDGVGPALIMRLLLELPESTPAYFRHLAEQPKMAEALWAAIRELRMAGLTAADLRRDAFTTADKHAELQALLAAYEEHLAAHHLADAAAVYHEALEHLDVCPIAPADVWIELPGVVWAPLEGRLLDGLPGTRLASESLELPGLEMPRRLGTLPAARRSVSPAPTSDAERLAFLLDPDSAPPSGRDGTLTMFRAGGKEAEVEEVFRRILAGGVPLDQVEVACAAPDYATLLWEKAQRHDWPITLDQGVPITLTRPARALLAFCAWIEDGFPAGGLRRLLQSGDAHVDLAGGPTAGQAARLLARSEATWGRQTYAPALAGLAQSYLERAADIDAGDEARARYRTRAAQAGRLRAWIDDLLRLVPEPAADGRIGLGALLTSCRTFIEQTAAKRSELDGAAASALADALDELTALGDLTRPLGEAFRLIRDRIERLGVGSDRARPGHLHVTMLSHAGYAGRANTFVVGLDEGSVLPAPLEDPVLLDDERRALDPALAQSGDRVSEALARVLSRLAALGGRVCLSFSCRELRQNRETFPSWLLLQALRVREAGRELTYEDLNRGLGEPVSAIPASPELALGDAGWWLASLRGAGASAHPAIQAAFPWVAQGARAEAERESEAFTPYEGFVRVAGAHVDPRVSGRSVSPTGLERAAACPFRYFLERGLGLEPFEDSEPDPDRWLDPATRGSVLHALYARIWRELRQRGERPDPERHGGRLRKLGREKLGELRTLIPPPSERVFEREAREILGDLDLFLRLEAGGEHRDPVGFEISFGGGGDEPEPLAQADPVLIDLGSGLRFRLRGRIDRLDRLRDGTYDVVDYKTGRYRRDAYLGRFMGGRLLQHALYALAARELIRSTDAGARVVSSSYYFPTARGRAERVTLSQEDPGRVAAVLRDLFDLLAQGSFVHTPERSDCAWCEFRRACGPDPTARAQRKIASPSNTSLAAYRRLAEHE